MNQRVKMKGQQAADQMKEFLETVKAGFEDAQIEYARMQEEIDRLRTGMEELEKEVKSLRSELSKLQPCW